MARRHRVMPTQKVIPTQTVVILLSLPPEEQEVLGAEAVNIMKQTICGRRKMTAAGTKPEAAGAQPEAAVAAMEKAAGKAEERLHDRPRHVRVKKAAEVTPLPNEDLAAVSNGATQGPPSRTHLEERGVREEGARTTLEAGIATPYRADPLPLPLRRFAAVPKHTSGIMNHEAAVAAMQGAGVPDPLPLLISEHHHEVAVATMQGATPGQPP